MESSLNQGPMRPVVLNHNSFEILTSTFSEIWTCSTPLCLTIVLFNLLCQSAF